MTSEEEIKKHCEMIGKVIGSALPEDVGFALLIFQYDPGNFLHYMSNAQRANMLSALKELIEVLENDN